MRRALLFVALATADVLLNGWWVMAAERVPYAQGVFWALQSGATVGWRTPDVRALWPFTLITLTLVPLFAASGGALLAAHMRQHRKADLAGHEERLKGHIEQRLSEHHKALLAAVRDGAASPAEGTTAPLSRKLRDPGGTVT